MSEDRQAMSEIETVSNEIPLTKQSITNAILRYCVAPSMKGLSSGCNNR